MPGDSYTRCYNKPPNRIPWYATDHNSIARIEFSFPFFVNCVIFSEVSKNCIKTVKSRINIPNCYTILSHIFSVKESIDRTSQYRLTLAHHLPFQTKSILAIADVVVPFSTVLSKKYKKVSCNKD